MANIIIAPEHQSAPRTVVMQPPKAKEIQWQGGKTHYGDYDDEMSPNATAADEQMQKSLIEFTKRKMERSPQQTVEAHARKLEEAIRDSKKFRWEGQERWQGKENEEMRLVNIISAHTFIEKLAAVGVKASLYENNRFNARIWLNDYIAPITLKNQKTGETRVVSSGRIGVNAWVPDTVRGFGKMAKTITTVQYPLGPEFSVMRFNEYNVPTQEKYRGWRTALLAMILAEVITEDEADLAFGKPIENFASEFYREQLYAFRNRANKE